MTRPIKRRSAQEKFSFEEKLQAAMKAYKKRLGTKYELSIRKAAAR
jgi:hypothetical protein